MHAIASESESLVDLHVARLEFQICWDPELFLYFRLIVVDLNPFHLAVAQRPIGTITVTTSADVIGVDTKVIG